MADVIGSVPFGIDDLQLEGREADGSASGTLVDVFGATSFSVGTESDTTEARGDNRLIRLRRSNKRASGSAAMLNHQPAVMAVIGDGVSTTDGVTPNVVTTYGEPDTSDSLPYIIHAQAGDGAGATRLIVLNAVTTGGPTFDWTNEAFAEPSWDFEGSGAEFADAGAGTYLWVVQNYETEAPIAAIGTP